MTVKEQREALKKAFPGAKWVERVKAMRDDQVTAIYLNLKSQNKL